MIEMVETVETVETDDTDDTTPATELSFDSPDQCQGCHPEHYEQWSMSPHAYAAQDPVFLAMVELGQRRTKGELGEFCVQCHTPPGTLSGQTAVEFDELTQTYVQDLQALDPVAQAGVSCDVCHSIESIEHPFNAGINYATDGHKRGTIEDPQDAGAHGSEYSPLHKESELCSGCHGVINDQGALLDLTYDEWLGSSHAEQGRTCQDCHMKPSTGAVALGGPEDRQLHDHHFVGVDVSLLPPEQFPGYDQMRELTRQLLQSAAQMEVQAQQRALDVTVQNLAGHALPTGSTADRQMWLQLEVTDEDGQVVFTSGTLDERDDIRDGLAAHSLEPGTDPQLAYWGQQLIYDPRIAQATNPAEREQAQRLASEDCLPMGLGAVVPQSPMQPVSFGWDANWQCDYLIAADSAQTHHYVLPADMPRGRYHATVRLLYRTFPPHFLRGLEQDAGLDPDVRDRVPTVVMAEASQDWVVQDG